ncbi:MAG: 3-deoxy-manno-octulosonate cytidylyltransferase [Cyclobacteriaceae bacterium]|nr:3-deoxy-manno-octulosonate cytidylyltransferase [Cyclobacteriaceae bacterium]MCB9238894.1 3-deoxy-manno-octulosonate cytidylyltransferase [Flammeovirgaceae bacterium]MCB0498170.1 3-deoxy-manno-octulosonate cytidylyltransferase [Cyclobacteriaceae bacterium]MCO5270613.1 3-deoxy-manno-octulosonate cytidylyltransferase [Cyclobacteriaceae bacterium]MCW5900946.1 3-deoxy-manno-octulosonate cytidylyltransferase [Cyclobacteriaceae bacterium]
MKIVGIIPARYASTRFPAKPLADIAGQTMIEWVYGQAKKSGALERVVVATDNQKIYDHVKNKGGEVCMTSENHVSGTDRCAEALASLGGPYDYVVNIQGDEPFIDPRQIDLLATLLDGEAELATLIKKIASPEALHNGNIVKVVCNVKNEAIYFSRSALPHLRNVQATAWFGQHTYYKHIGMYGYRTDILGEITQLAPSSLELAESLEQLRWIENGYTIKVAETDIESMGIDTPEDLEKAVEYLIKK